MLCLRCRTRQVKDWAEIDVEKYYCEECWRTRMAEFYRRCAERDRRFKEYCATKPKMTWAEWCKWLLVHGVWAQLDPVFAAEMYEKYGRKMAFEATTCVLEEHEASELDHELVMWVIGHPNCLSKINVPGLPVPTLDEYGQVEGYIEWVDQVKAIPAELFLPLSS